jgi:hypothetical protein
MPAVAELCIRITDTAIHIENFGEVKKPNKRAQARKNSEGERKP